MQAQTFLGLSVMLCALHKYYDGIPPTSVLEELPPVNIQQEA
jgi:hypothetical protein